MRRQAESCLQVDIERQLSQFCAERFVTSDLRGSTPRQVIDELVSLLADGSVLPDKKAAVDAAMTREEILTTAVRGIAFPHVRGLGDGSVVCAVGLSRGGVDWAGERVHVIVFTTLPGKPDPLYLRLMMAFSKSFSTEKRMSAICACETDQEFWEDLCKATNAAFKRI